jgi:hypothetical protein
MAGKLHQPSYQAQFILQELPLSESSAIRNLLLLSPGKRRNQRSGLLGSVFSRHPSGGSIGAIVGPSIEGNRRARGSLTNSVDDDF